MMKAWKEGKKTRKKIKEERSTERIKKRGNEWNEKNQRRKKGEEEKQRK
jgi:hypothetical protein